MAKGMEIITKFPLLPTGHPDLVYHVKAIDHSRGISAEADGKSRREAEEAVSRMLTEMARLIDSVREAEKGDSGRA